MDGEAGEYAAELRTRFGASLQRRRNALRLSQRALGERHGVSQRLVSSAELGTANTTLSTLARLARAVGSDVATMLAEKD